MTEKRFALVGNQNCGKTTLFNALTGANQYVGNWPGVTVDQVIGKMSSKDWDIVDLPGLYSLSPYSAEEVVSRNFLLSDNYDVILNVLDASHLERSLSLTYECLPMGKPMVVALNMIDVLTAHDIKVDVEKLSKALGVKVVPISAANKQGLDALLKAMAEAKAPENPLAVYPERVQECIKSIGALLGDVTASERVFISTALLQGDKIYLEQYKRSEMVLNAVSKGRGFIEDEFKVDAESFFPQQRYKVIENTVKAAVENKFDMKSSFSQKIDNIVTNRFLALPIFLAIVWVVYYLAVETIGTMGTDYANDVIFGEIVPGWAESLLASADAPEWMNSLVIDGVIGGVGAVLGFVPQMIVMFLLLSFLEQCGYMTRVAFVLDSIFRRFGLSGRNFIPMVVATGCGVPALMANKTIDNINERRIGLITTTFIPCSAKLPILTMIFVAFFDGQAWFAPFVYGMSIFSVIVTGIIFKKDRAFKEPVSPFVMELPDYHMPTLFNILRATYERCKAFVIKAGTIIFAVVVVVWFLSNFNFTEEGFTMVDVNDSLLAVIGTSIAFIFAPLGFATWQATVAAITGLLAKENVVGTLAVTLGLEGDFEGGEDTLNAALQGHFSMGLVALSYLTFNMWSTPCVAALGAMKRQLGNNKWFAFAIVYMTMWAYCLALVIYQLGGLIMGVVPFSAYTVAAFIVLGIFLFLLLRPERKATTEILIPSKNI
jgi:ferrous iron transport protein B